VKTGNHPAQRPGEITILVRDNGIGIHPRHQARVFDLFRRLHSADQYAGEGLGLALVRKIIELHGGRIDLESSGIPGEGTTFRIHLPAAATEPRVD
jgi:signal transduction histidine kinase